MDDRSGRRRIAVVTEVDARNPRSLSGTPYSITRTLEKHCGDVDCLGPAELPIKRVALELNALARITLKKQYDVMHNQMLARSYARYFGHKLARENYDVIFATYASTEIARLKTDIPIVYVTDLTFELALDSHPSFSNLLRVSRRQGEEIERAAIHGAALVIYPSQWAARSAIEHYGADSEKVLVIPNGPNLEEVPSREEVLQREKGQTCRLLFVGVGWERKGGPIVVETMRQLEALGIEVELTVCGCVPPMEADGFRIRVIPFLDKNDPRQRKELLRLYLDSDLFFLPTRIEAFGASLIEACACGLPVISTEVGGVSEVVREGENGHTLPYGAGGRDYARLIADIFRDDVRYERLCRSARQEYEERLNWDAWGMAVREVMENLLPSG